MLDLQSHEVLPSVDRYHEWCSDCGMKLAGSAVEGFGCCFYVCGRVACGFQFHVFRHVNFHEVDSVDSAVWGPMSEMQLEEDSS